MHAFRYYGIEDIRLDDILKLEYRPGCIKLKPSYVSICGSDIYVSLVTPTVTFNYGGIYTLLPSNTSA